uniref:Uncharacterized protein n=1 Tax=Globisporangium ultimum (strain ATCC 200006 / CBS 805.95 / DAOM BR144) TaxID=431595 RepID=K3WBV5_GLOUD
MDLIEAMEEMEQLAKQPPAPAHVQQHQLYAAHRPVTCAPVASPESGASWDFVLQQVAFVQTRLKALWQLKSRNESGVQVPSSWVLSKLLRLIEEYPDGVTEAIVVTELMTLLQRKVYVSSGASASSKKIRNVDDITRVLSEMEDSNDAVAAKLVCYDGYKLSLDAQSSVSLELEMYLHQRFRSCAAFLGSQPQFHSKSGVGFPFQSGRSFVFTNAKVMERKDIGASSASGGEESKSRESQEEIYYLLPTQYLALHLNASSALDQMFARQAINLGRLDQLAAMQDQAILQQLVVNVKILDIGAIRPSQTPLHIYRQVVFLGEVSNVPAGSISSTQRVAQASHVMILWDDQVALSRLFHVGDELSIFQPYIHICEPHDTEIVHIFSEYSSQQRCMFYLEYGSATVLFLNSQSKKPSSRNANGSSDDVVARRESEVQAFQESELPPLRYEDIKHEWLNFSVYGHVSSIRVSHGTPLMAAYFYSYYDPKTNTAPQQNSRATASASTATPTLDRAIVSKFYLVVLLEIYNASSQQTLAVEVTGGNALKALPSSDSKGT